MDPKAVEKIHNAMMTAMRKLDREYLELMMRMGVRSIPLHRL